MQERSSRIHRGRFRIHDTGGRASHSAAKAVARRRTTGFDMGQLPIPVALRTTAGEHLGFADRPPRSGPSADFDPIDRRTCCREAFFLLGALAAILFAAYRLIQTLAGERIDEMVKSDSPQRPSSPNRNPSRARGIGSLNRSRTGTAGGRFRAGRRWRRYTSLPRNHHSRRDSPRQRFQPGQNRRHPDARSGHSQRLSQGHCFPCDVHHVAGRRLLVGWPRGTLLFGWGVQFSEADALVRDGLASGDARACEFEGRPLAPRSPQCGSSDRGPAAG